jgi:hypothetical protein
LLPTFSGVWTYRKPGVKQAVAEIQTRRRRTSFHSGCERRLRLNGQRFFDILCAIAIGRRRQMMECGLATCRQLIFGLAMLGVAVSPSLVCGQTPSAQQLDLETELTHVQEQIKQDQVGLAAAEQHNRESLAQIGRDIENLSAKLAADQKQLNAHRLGCDYLLHGSKALETREEHNGILDYYGKEVSRDEALLQGARADRTLVMNDKTASKLRAEISQLQGRAMSLRSRITQAKFQLPPQPAPTPNVLPPPNPSVVDPTASTPGGNYRPQPGLPRQPEPARWTDDQGNERNPPPPASDLWNSTQLKTWPAPGAPADRGEAPWGFFPGEDPSVVGYDANGEPYDADGFLVEYRSAEERTQVIAEIRAANREAEAQRNRMTDQQDREMKQWQRDNFGPDPTTATADDWLLWRTQLDRATKDMPTQAGNGADGSFKSQVDAMANQYGNIVENAKQYDQSNLEETRKKLLEFADVAQKKRQEEGSGPNKEMQELLDKVEKNKEGFGISDKGK